MLCDTFSFLAGFSSFFERKRMSRRVFLTKRKPRYFWGFYVNCWEKNRVRLEKSCSVTVEKVVEVEYS